MDTVKLYGKFLAIHLKSAMVYRWSFFLSCLGTMLTTANVFLGVVFLMARFETIQGYTLPQLTLGFAVILMATSLAECFARGLDNFSGPWPRPSSTASWCGPGASSSSLSART